MTYPKRLIEVDLPIKRISAHARREKSIRHGHISTLHIWWARRPLAACRAVLCASLWPAPADAACPPAFREAARTEMRRWLHNDRLKLLSAESTPDFIAWQKEPARLDDDANLQRALFHLIADFANWDNSTREPFLNTARTLTQAAHAALGGLPGTRPLVVDPFAGGGAIPLEALRVGADAFASDLNPVAVLLNKVVLEYIPKYGQRLADEVRKWGEWIKQEAEKELAPFYPKDADGATPIAYLWARTIVCEGPGCGAEVPLLRSLWVAKKAGRSVAFRLVPDQQTRNIDIRIMVRQHKRWTDGTGSHGEVTSPKFDGTVQRGHATCPCCGYTTPVERVREQLKSRRGGADSSRLLCVVTIKQGESGRTYRLPLEQDLVAVKGASAELIRQQSAQGLQLSLVPNELISLNEIRRISIPLYGMESWGDVYSSRQGLALATLARLARDASKHASAEIRDLLLQLFAVAIGRQADACSTLARWHTTGEKNTGTFGRQALGMIWDYAEVNPFSGSTGSWDGVIEWIAKVCESQAIGMEQSGQVQQASATASPLADDTADAWVTDPPYYDAVPYSHLSDYFYVWMKRVLFDQGIESFRPDLVPKSEEIVVDRPHYLSTSQKDVAFYERELTRAFSEGRRVLQPNGIGAIVFASKSTASWEAILGAVIDAGWIVSGSWPIDTEMAARVAAQGQARLASSVHLICRPRENAEGELIVTVGDWRNILHELPQRIHTWLPRLASEGVVGADAIFACLGPALEIFSRYSRVEKASGEVVTLGEYLEHVWAAVSKAALAMVFEGADTAGFEEDARLTAMWLWTLSTDDVEADADDDDDDAEEGAGGKRKTPGGYALEYDAARKIAQGLGAHLETLGHLVEVKGGNARLLPVRERTRYLFGREDVQQPAPSRRRGVQQASLFAELAAEDAAVAAWLAPAEFELRAGRTTLDRVHQAMLLFGAGRSDALRRFLVDEGVGRDERLWRLAQALSALYPTHSEEKRWVDGVLARKKGLGL